MRVLSLILMTLLAPSPASADAIPTELTCDHKGQPSVLFDGSCLDPQRRKLRLGPEHSKLDLAPLTHLPWLRALTVTNAPQVRLQSFRAIGTRLELIGPAPYDLAALPPVQQLTLRNTQADDLTPLARQKPLSILSFKDMAAPDLSTLPTLQKLSILQLRQIKGLDPAQLASLPPLEVLAVEDSGLTDGADLPQVEVLALAGNPLQDISLLADHNRLTSLDLSRTQVTDLSPLTGSKLAHLYVSSTAVHDISVVSTLPHLSTLMLNDSAVRDLAPLAQSPRPGSLTALHIARTKVSDLSPLKRLTGLRQVDLRGTAVTDLSPLQHLPLRRLTLPDGSHLKEANAIRKAIARHSR